MVVAAKASLPAAAALLAVHLNFVSRANAPAQRYDEPHTTGGQLSIKF
jgi:hypothetical protein